jgi:hypothetical protein
MDLKLTKARSGGDWRDQEPTALGCRDVEPQPRADNLPCAALPPVIALDQEVPLLRYRTGVDLAGGWGVRRRPCVRRMEASALEVERWRPAGSRV